MTADIWNKIKYYSSYWYIFLLFTIGFLIAARIYIYIATPIYEASASILIKAENKEEDEKSIHSLNLFGSKKILENEIEVIRSSTVLSQTVKNLRLYAPVSRKNKIGSASAYILSPILVEMRQPDQLVEHDKEEIYFEYDSVYEKVRVRGSTFPLGSWINFGRGEMRFIRNPNVKRSSLAGPYFFKLVKVQKITEQLLLKLDVLTSNKLSTVIDLKLQDEIAKRAVDILNEIMNVYMQVDVADKVNISENAVRFLDGRIEREVSELNSVETSLQRFKSDKGGVDIGEQGRLFLGNVGRNTQDINQINTQLAILSQLEDYVNSKNENSKLIPSVAGLNDLQLSQLVDKLYGKEGELARLKGNVAENNPISNSLKNEIDNLRSSIKQNVNGLKRNLEVSRQNLSQAGGQYNLSLKSIPEKEKELLELNRKQSIKNDIYTFLLQKREEAILTSAISLSDSRIIDHAQASLLPVKPKKSIIYLAALIFGIGGVSLYFYIKSILNPIVLSKEDILHNTPIPIVGSIRSKRKHTGSVSNKSNRSTEQDFREIRNHLNFDSFGLSKHKKILVTSLNKSDGKGFAAINLANSLTKLNAKTIVINLSDNDRSLERNAGFVDWLSGRKEKIDIIQHSETNPDLFLVSLGTNVANIDLFRDNKFFCFFCELQSEYDNIIIVSPPLEESDDGYILSKWCDITLFVVRRGRTPVSSIKNLTSHSASLEFHNPAILFNCGKG